MMENENAEVPNTDDTGVPEKETLGKAIVAAADKDYATFKGSIADVIRDRVSDAVKDAADEIRQNLFKKPEEE